MIQALATREPGDAQSDPLDTRERLLQVAIRLFAEHGIDRVSLKMISDEAGNRNKSAVGYHFENKQGLIDAVLQRLERDLAPNIASSLAAFEAVLEGGGEVSIPDLALGLLEPVFTLYVDTPYGPDALRVLARLMHYPLEGLPLAQRDASGALVRRAVLLLQRLMPHKPAYLVQHHVHHAVMATVNGLALQQRFIADHHSLWTRRTLEEIFLSYAAYVAAGLSAMPLSTPSKKAGSWTASGGGVQIPSAASS